MDGGGGGYWDKDGKNEAKEGVVKQASDSCRKTEYVKMTLKQSSKY